MKTATEKLQQLKPNSVWVFTKQETDFDDSYKSALLFSEITDKEHTNIEDFLQKTILDMVFKQIGIGF